MKTNWNLVPMNTLVMVSDDDEHYYKGYFYRQVEDGFQTFPEPMNFASNLNDMAVTWFYIKPYEEITVDKLDKEYESYCDKVSSDDCINRRCKYHGLNEKYYPICHYNWLLDHYNLTEKE